jgi:hypothetical protein
MVKDPSESQPIKAGPSEMGEPGSFPQADIDGPVEQEVIPLKDSLLSDRSPHTISSFRLTPEGDLNLIKVYLRSTGDKKRDTLRMRRVYGLLTTYHGVDRFAVFIFEGSRRYHLEFPNDTTGFCPELDTQLRDLVGEANVQIESLHLQ